MTARHPGLTPTAEAVAEFLRNRLALARPVPGAPALAAAASHAKVLEIEVIARKLADVYKAVDGTPVRSFMVAAGVWPWQPEAEEARPLGRELRRIARATGDLEPVVDRFEAAS